MKVRFITAADLVMMLEAAQRQGKLKEAMHRAVSTAVAREICTVPLSGCSARDRHDAVSEERA